jgi:hypothetical protein
MSTNHADPHPHGPSAPTPAAERQPVWKNGVAAAVVASVATTVLASVASAAGVMAGKARRATFVRTAVALTALPFVPDLTFGFDAGSAATLIRLHTVAAAIVVPTLEPRATLWPPRPARRHRRQRRHHLARARHRR